MSLEYKITLWLWPTGLYPARVVHYLKAKHLPREVLAHITIIPEMLDTSVGGIRPVNGDMPARPEGFSLPCLAVEPLPTSDMSTSTRNSAKNANRESKTRYISQASAILEFLEDVLPPTHGHEDMSLRGANAIQTGRVRDVVNMFSEALVAVGFHARHAFASTLLWSGMTAEEQGVGAAADAWRETRRRVGALERWVAREEVEGWIAGTSTPSIADFTVFGGVEYVGRMYPGLDMFEGFEALQRWRDRCREDQDFATAEEMVALERGEGFEWAPVAGG